MKKIIAISVMFALIAGAVFADTSIGGGFNYQLDVLRGDNGKNWTQASPGKEYYWEASPPSAGDTTPTWVLKDKDKAATYVVDPTDPYGETLLGTASQIQSQTNFKGATVDFNFSGDTYGGKVRLYAAGSQGWWGSLPFAFAWWQPVSMFKFQLGHNPDGNFGTAQITGWGFNGSAQDFVATDNDSGGSTSYIAVETGGIKSYSRNRAWRAARSYGFYGGYSNVAALLSLYPMDMLTVNLVLPFSAAHADQTRDFTDVLMNAHLNFVVNIDGVGRITLTFEGKGGNKTVTSIDTTDNTAKSKKEYNSTGNVWLSYTLTSVENLLLDVGVGYGLAYTKYGYTGYVQNLFGTKVDPGMQFGLGVRYTAGDFGVKLRVAGLMLEKEVAYGLLSNVTTNKPMKIGVGVLPYFNLGGPTIYLNAGFGMETATTMSGSGITVSDGKSYTDWYVNPYVKIPAGGLTFWAGIKILGDTKLGHADGTLGNLWYDAHAKQNGSTMEWQIPIGISVGF